MSTLCEGDAAHRWPDGASDPQRDRGGHAAFAEVAFDLVAVREGG